MTKKLSLGNTFYNSVIGNKGMEVGAAEVRAIKRLFSNFPTKLGNPYAALEEFNDCLAANPLPISADLHTKGQEWFIKAKRVILKYAMDSYQGVISKALVEMATEGKIASFHFLGLLDYTTGTSFRAYPRQLYTVPVWKVTLKNGESFSYAYGSWQTYSTVLINPFDE